MSKPITGACLCGRVKYQVTGPFDLFYLNSDDEWQCDPYSEDGRAKVEATLDLRLPSLVSFLSNTLLGAQVLPAEAPSA